MGRVFAATGLALMLLCSAGARAGVARASRLADLSLNRSSSRPLSLANLRPANIESFVASNERGRIMFAQRQGSASGSRTSSDNGSALLTALMSAVVPGAGQIRNGSILRGIGYAALEVSGWVAYLSFRQGAEDRYDDVVRTADNYWSLERYSSRVGLPDSCAACGCPDGQTIENDLKLITESVPSDFYELVGRRAYGCGWDTALSESIYHGMWDDREDMKNAERWSGRLLFLNHLVSAVDAFLEARSLRLKLDDVTVLSMKIHGLPFHIRPEIRVTRRL